MEKRLKALQAQYLAKKTEAEGLTAKGEAATSDDIAKVTSLVEELKGIQSEIEAIKQNADALAKASSFLGARDPGQSVPGLEATPGPREREGKRAGTDLIELHFNGQPYRVDHEGFEMSEKAYHATQEESYRKAFRQYLRKGNDAGRTVLDTLAEVKNYQEGLDVAGGYLVPPQIIMEIIKRDAQDSNLLNEVRTVPCSSDKVAFPKLAYGSGDGDIYANSLRKQRTGETQGPASMTRQDLGMIEIPIFEGSMEMPIGRSMMADSAIPIDTWVAEMMRESFALDTESELLSGDGLKQPEGLLIGVGGTNRIPTVNIGNPVTGNGLLDLYYTLPRQYRANAKLLLNDQSVFRTWAKLTDTDGNYIFGLFKNADGGLATAREEVFLGKKMIFNPFMPDSGAAANTSVFGDFRKLYYYALRLGMTMEMQMLPRDAFAYAVFRFRDGGKVVQPRAARVGVQS